LGWDVRLDVGYWDGADRSADDVVAVSVAVRVHSHPKSSVVEVFQPVILSLFRRVAGLPFVATPDALAGTNDRRCPRAAIHCLRHPITFITLIPLLMSFSFQGVVGVIVSRATVISIAQSLLHISVLPTI
jgi:hypothetical protein